MWRCFVNEILTLKETQTQNRFKCCAIATKRRNIVTYHFGSKIMTDWKLRSARRFECARWEYKRIHHAKRSRTNAKQCKHNTHTTAHQSRTHRKRKTEIKQQQASDQVSQYTSYTNSMQTKHKLCAKHTSSRDSGSFVVPWKCVGVKPRAIVA